MRFAAGFGTDLPYEQVTEFLIGEIAEKLHLSREMGSLVAGVSLSTFPYALDVTAKVTTLRDFFITLFFVSLGMTIPIPGASAVLGALGAVLVAMAVGNAVLAVIKASDVMIATE